MISRLSARYYADLIGKPFRDGGRGPDTFDCLGVVLEVQRRLGNHPSELPSVASSFDIALGPHGEWLQVETPQPGDAVLLRMPGYPFHVAVVLDFDQMLHTYEGVNVSIARMSSLLYKHRIIGFYRWRKKSDA